jgi:hypothetical protein
MTEGRTLASLGPDARAVLSLVLERGRGWDEIAGMLGIEREAVRSRARAAADQLVGDDIDQPEPVDRGRLVDYVLGQQGVAERARTRRLLETSETARAWAQALTAAVAPMLSGPPPVPVAAPEPTPPVAAQREPAREPEPAPEREPAPDPAPAAIAPSSGKPRLGALQGAGAVVLATACVVAALILIGTSGGSSNALRRAGKQHGRAATAVHTVGRLVLSAAQSDSRALGAGAIVARRGSLLLLLQARGLAPNSKGNSYAVWLFNTEVDSRLLGFVSPPVGADGSFSSGTALPDDAVRFHEVLVTRETTTNPKQPGKVVLRSILSLG